jgi:hypothetical protein
MLFSTSSSTATIEDRIRGLWLANGAIPETYSDRQLWHLTHIERYSVLSISSVCYSIQVTIVYVSGESARCIFESRSISVTMHRVTASIAWRQSTKCSQLVSVNTVSRGNSAKRRQALNKPIWMLQIWMKIQMGLCGFQKRKSTVLLTPTIPFAEDCLEDQSYRNCQQSIFLSRQA